MAPSDRPSHYPSPIQGQPGAPLVRSEYHMYLHPRQPFSRYEHGRRHPNSRIPNQGPVDRLPGVASLLRRHNAMQARGLISPVRNPGYELEERRLSEANRTFECWTPPRLVESPGALDSPGSKWMPLTAALESTQHRLNDWSSSLRNFEPKSIDQVRESRMENTKTSSPVTRSPEPARGPNEPRPKTSRYLREIDRRRILMRIAQGEKQSALAKEYQVSRAAICNLNKHRAEVLSRNHEHPLAKHPKRRMLTKTTRQENKVLDANTRQC
ncbi:hypothetical protein PHYPSEUDO_005371 [Phytophthora pseudosyringae]|uniref:HTH psq-type domain-containing protein n=1 Tax=Phytophthora pseudosyringae TaxID=221518 RepID=A0A8T1VPP8_9STRA|nr:hypothetical protein PHYPSEUDO_005371 [Phytophthora pseudosyringae]